MNEKELLQNLEAVISCFMVTDEWEDGTPCYEAAMSDRDRDKILSNAAYFLLNQKNNCPPTPDTCDIYGCSNPAAVKVCEEHYIDGYRTEVRDGALIVKPDRKLSCSYGK